MESEFSRIRSCAYAWNIRKHSSSALEAKPPEYGLGASRKLVAGQRGLLTSMAPRRHKKCGSFRRLGRQELKGAQCGARLHPRRLRESAGLDAETGPTHTASRSGGASAHIYHRQDSGGRRPVRRWRQSQNSLFGYPLLRLSAVSRWSLCDADYRRMRELRPKLLRRLLRAISE